MTDQDTAERSRTGRSWLWWGWVPLLAVAGGRFAPFSHGVTLSVVSVGATMVIVGIMWRGRRRIAPRRLDAAGVAPWVVVLLSFSAIELVNDHLGSTHAHPTFSVLLAPAILVEPLRVLAWAVWLWFGAYLVTG